MRGCRRAVWIARLYLTTAEQRRVLRLADNNFGIGQFLGEHARDAFQRAAGAIPGHPVVELLALEVVDDLTRRGAAVDVRVSFILELTG